MRLLRAKSAVFFVIANSLLDNCPSVLGSVYDMTAIKILSQLTSINANVAKE